MAIDPHDSDIQAGGSFSPDQTHTKQSDRSDESNFVQQMSASGSSLSPKELQKAFENLKQNLSVKLLEAEEQYLEIQGKYQGKNLSKEDQLNVVGKLNNVLMNVREEVKRVVSDTLFQGDSPILSKTNIEEERVIDQTLQMVDESNPDLKKVYNAKYVKDPNVPFPSEESCLNSHPGMEVPNVAKSALTQQGASHSAPVYPVPPTTIPADAPPGSVPVVVTIPPGSDLNDIYVRVDGPSSCYELRADGTAAGSHTWTKGDQDMSKYGVPFSKLPHTGNTVTLYIPPGASGRIYFSVGKPIQWAAPSRQNGSDPDNSIQYSMMEYTNNGVGKNVNLDESAVDGFSGPSISTQAYKNQQAIGTPMGTTTLPNSFIQNMKDYIDTHVTDPTAKAAWEQLFSSSGGVNYINAPKMRLDVFGPYFHPYINKVLVPYMQNHPIYFDINQTKLLIKASSDGNNLEYCDYYSGKVLGTVPVSSITSNSWLSGAPAGVPGLSGTQDAVAMQGLSALLMSGLDLGTLSTSSTNPLSNTSFVEDEKEGKFFQASYNGMPMFNVYERAMHAEGYNAYAYDYDDLFNVSQDVDIPLSEKPGFSILLNWS